MFLKLFYYTIPGGKIKLLSEKKQYSAGNNEKNIQFGYFIVL